MAAADKKVSEHDILATNVLPALIASLEHGVSAAELESELGWRLEDLQQPGATVSGASTYRHMEMMARRADYAGFVIRATEFFKPSHLGVLGLAGKTSATVGEALTLHQRYQLLTNRTATYHSQLNDTTLVLTESRPDPSLGSMLISEYTMLIAAHLLRQFTAGEVEILELQTRRVSMSEAERIGIEDFVGAPVVFGCKTTSLHLSACAWKLPVASQDDELATYFKQRLETLFPAANEPKLVTQVRDVLLETLVFGVPTTAQIASQLGFGARSLQRRLAAHGTSVTTLLEQTRKSLAQTYLQDRELSLAEVTYRLGYSEQKSFFRAFRRWHDMTPGQWRAAHES